MAQDYELDSSLEDRFGKCPYSTVQSLISGKWAMLILYYLMDGPVRFNELQRQMPKMTHATLSVQLKGLVEKGLVRRKQYETIPPVVEYSLTDIGMLAIVLRASLVRKSARIPVSVREAVTKPAICSRALALNFVSYCQPNVCR